MKSQSALDLSENKRHVFFSIHIFLQRIACLWQPSLKLHCISYFSWILTPPKHNIFQWTVAGASLETGESAAKHVEEENRSARTIAPILPRPMEAQSALGMKRKRKLVILMPVQVDKQKFIHLFFSLDI